VADQGEVPGPEPEAVPLLDESPSLYLTSPNILADDVAHSSVMVSSEVGWTRAGEKAALSRT